MASCDPEKTRSAYLLPSADLVLAQHVPRRSRKNKSKGHRTRFLPPNSEQLTSPLTSVNRQSGFLQPVLQSHSTQGTDLPKCFALKIHRPRPEGTFDGDFFRQIFKVDEAIRHNFLMAAPYWACIRGRCDHPKITFCGRRSRHRRRSRQRQSHPLQRCLRFAANGEGRFRDHFRMSRSELDPSGWRFRLRPQFVMNRTLRITA